jgi:tetratricopeptide (TPR) repeat protein
MKTFTKSIGSLLFFVCFFSFCSKETEDIKEIFTKVENIVEQQPDSALHLLYSILFAEDLNEKQFNKYNLLLIQARDKCDKDITADTVIFAVKDYYVQRKDYPNAALAAFYCGRVLHEQKNIEKAASAYFAAEELANRTEAYNLRGLIQGNLSILYREQFLNDEAIIRGKNAVVLYNKATNYKNEIDALRLIGNCFLIKNKTDSAFYYYKESLRLADYYKIPKEQAYARQNISIAYRNTGDYINAKKNLQEALSFQTDSTEQARIFMNLAKIYILENKIDSAKIYADYSLNLQAQEPSLLKSTYFLLSEIAKKEDHYKESLHYFREYYTYAMQVIDDNKNTALMELQGKYDFEKLKNKNSQLTIKQQKTVIIDSIVLLCFSFLAFFFYLKSVKNKKIASEAEQKMEVLRGMAHNYSEKDNSFRSILLHHFDILSKAVFMDRYISSSGSNREEGERLLKKFNEIVYGQNNLNWDLLYQAMNQIQYGLYDRIREKYPQLDVTEFRICCLSCEKFTGDEIAIIMNLKLNTVQKKRSIIRKKIGTLAHGNLRAFFLEKLSTKD